jgi:UDP-N-acetylmuramoyl-tripeptide--D-alanyl-D-alanine ligase
VKLTLADARTAMRAVGDLADRAEVMPRRAATDSREVGHGDVFFCIRGERVDGHDYARAAVAAGAVAVVAGRVLPDAGAPVLVADDVAAALGRLAAAHRARSSSRVIGVTGSAGKTTVKELLAAVLSCAGETARNRLNLNNQIGMPLSMLAASGDERFWVMEAGISEPRDMDELGAVLRPDLAVVVNVGPAHLEALGDVAGVARHKARLLAWTSDANGGGQGLVSADYPELVAAARAEMAGVAFFSARGADADAVEVPGRMVCTARYLGAVAEGGRFLLTLEDGELDLTLPLRGAFLAESVAAAAGAALLAGCAPETVALGLAKAELPRQRFSVRPAAVAGWTVIDDSYNANPLSLQRAMEAAAEMARASGALRELVLVLGEMRELGADAVRAHREAGAQAARLGAAVVFWKGGHAEDVEQGLRAENFEGVFRAEAAPGDVRDYLAGRAGNEGVVLVKGSHSNHMEHFTSAIVRENADVV